MNQPAASIHLDMLTRLGVDERDTWLEVESRWCAFKTWNRGRMTVDDGRWVVRMLGQCAASCPCHCDGIDRHEQKKEKKDWCSILARFVARRLILAPRKFPTPLAA